MPPSSTSPPARLPLERNYTVVTQLGPGQALGRYELLLPIAKGGMAQVWAARLCGTRGFQKTVAIKTILGDQSTENQRFEQMFLEEARLAAQIQHPNVVATLELGEESDTLYLVMEWVHGEPLRTLQLAAHEHGGIPRAIAVNLIGQVCKGLHAAHEARDHEGQPLGIVHRDVSPQNVLVSYSGTVKLVDFGIAKATVYSTELTQHGELKGKLSYMSPEQLLERPLDRRADIFSMGILLYTLTTGRHPFKADAAVQTLHNICDLPPLAPSRFMRSYPRPLEEVVMKALAKNPDERWATAQEMFEALIAAEPEALKGSSEAQIAAYMQEILGETAQERLQALASAQRWVDQLHGEEPVSASYLQNLMLEVPQPLAQQPNASLSPHALEQAPDAERLGADGDESTGVANLRKQRTRRKWLVGSSVTAVGLGLALFGSLAVLGESSDRRPDSTLSLATSASPSAMAKTLGAVGAAAAAQNSSPAPTTVTPPLAPTAETSPSGQVNPLSNEPGTTKTATPGNSRPRKRHKEPKVQKRRSHLKAVAAEASTNSTNKSPPVGDKATAPKKAKVDAWDRSLYGGRN